MSFFQPTPTSRYDLRFSIAGIPVRVHPLFWLIALLLGASGDLLQIVIWILVVFVSILIHELGHAFAFRWYGLRSQILLHFSGGLTIPEMSPWGSGYASVAIGPVQQILISLAGPGAGFLLAGLIIVGVQLLGGSVANNNLFGLLPLPTSATLPFGGFTMSIFLTMMLWVNVFWGLINLLPIYPLDGGQVARNILLMYDPIGGVRKSLWLSVIAGGLMALAGFVLFHSAYTALLFGLLAFQSYQALQNRFGSGY
ncbi:MAG: site-2 protease family protein [Anaerolineae bacterium]|nr:site-2 protease family protein [Anaerolineae bacterium]MBL8106810.1 site-2 protease family protein [Anaerolineales bacterium]